MSAFVENNIYQALVAHKFKSLGAMVLLVAGLGAVAYVSLSAQPDTTPATVIVVPQAPLIRAEPGSLRPSSVITGAGPTASVSRGFTTPAGITRTLQSRLATAGCYEGPMNGQWSVTTKDAMRRFVTAANARLPVEFPDHVLLALVDSNANLKCSNTQTATAHSTDAQVARSDPEAPPIAPTANSQPPLIRVTKEDPQQLTISGSVALPSPSHPSSTELDDRLVPGAGDGRDDVIVPPLAVAAAPRPSAPIVGASAVSAREATVTAPAKKARRVSYTRSKMARKKPSTIDSVSRSITKSVDSLQRSLGSLLN